MNTKLILNHGLSFSEYSDLRELEKQASKGWHLDKIVGAGLFFKLVKGPSEKVIYAIDYQNKPDKDYYAIFKEAKWDLVTSSGNQIHIFKAPEGTKPIYTNETSEKDKYKDVAKASGKLAVLGLTLLVLSIIAILFSLTYMKNLFIPSLIITIVSIFVFIFGFMPYVSFNLMSKGLIQPGFKKDSINHETITYSIIGIVNIVIGFMNFKENNLLIGSIGVIIGSYFMIKVILSKLRLANNN